ncbi:MAG: hypothetical protein ACWGMZ_13140, partial [Thermoguttaceae bacterium]
MADANLPRQPRKDKTNYSGQYTQPRQKKSRWMLRLCILFLFLGAFVWLLPLVVCKTPILGWAVQKAAGNLKGSLTIQSASLGWLSPIS